MTLFGIWVGLMISDIVAKYIFDKEWELILERMIAQTVALMCVGIFYE